VRNLLEKTKNLKRKDGVEVSIWADLLVGFPWENEEDFMETYKLVEDGLITKCHIFPFSSHKIWETVPASKLPNQIPEKIKKERVKKLEEIWEKVRQDFIKRHCVFDAKSLKINNSLSWSSNNEKILKQIQNNEKKELEVLVEVVKNEDWKQKWKGWTQNYIEANEKNFKIIFWETKRNSIIKWILSKI
jgi:threonylcarbamoyladenosine tRNA methylthiotransferase MtaB